jgi:hypothetical protein
LRPTGFPGFEKTWAMFQGPPGKSAGWAAVSAALIKDDAVRNYALRSGFYVVEQTGDKVRITAPEQVRVW